MDIKEVALAIEHLKVDELTTLQQFTDAQRDAYAHIGYYAVQHNKELLQRIHDLEHKVVNSSGISEAYDHVTELRLFHTRTAEQIEAEFRMSAESERTDSNNVLMGRKRNMYFIRTE